MCKGHEKRCKGLRIFQNFKVPCTSSCGPCTKLYCLSLVWPLHTSEALAPLLVALAHIQVALAPNSICQICGPCTWPLHLFSWPLHRPLPQKNEPFRPSKRYFQDLLCNAFNPSHNGLKFFLKEHFDSQKFLQVDPPLTCSVSK